MWCYYPVVGTEFTHLLEPLTTLQACLPSLMPNPKPGKAIPDTSSFGRGGRGGPDNFFQGHVLLLCPGPPQREQTIVLFALLEVLIALLEVWSARCRTLIGVPF